MIVKGGIELEDIEAWARHAGPKLKTQWRDGRSAKESARAWLQAAPNLPIEIDELIHSHSNFSKLVEWIAEPEALVRFDKFRGEPANVDVLVRGNDTLGPIVMAVEAKADERFGDSIGNVLMGAKSRLEKNPQSKGVKRLLRLCKGLLGIEPHELSLINDLRYQLLTITAAALVEAERCDATRAVVLIHEFITDKTQYENHRVNQLDLERFLTLLGSYGKGIGSGKMFGPIQVPGSPLISSSVRLYLGKATINLRSLDV